ncbi:MAG: hypothetical protein AABX19_01415 [Nanoarchaeota archaeon]
MTNLENPLLKSIDTLLIETQERINHHNERYVAVVNPNSENAHEREDSITYGKLIELEREDRKVIWDEFYASISSTLPKIKRCRY